MKLTVVNGSPRGDKSNSARIVSSWMFPEDDSFEYELLKAREILKDENRLLGSTSDYCLFIFPLYVDSVPGILKAVFELMESHKYKFKDKKIGFIIHSGFPEPRHSRAAEKYIEYFAGLMGMDYMGTVVMGGSEALQVAPDGFFGKKPKLFRLIGQNIKNGQPFDKETVSSIAGRELMSKTGKVIVERLNTGKFYWNREIKKNGVFDKRLDKPYA